MLTRLAPLALFLCAAAVASPVHMQDWPQGCLVATDQYQLSVDVTRTPMVRLLSADGKTPLASLDGLWLEEGKRFSLTAPGPTAHFHPLRSGPYLVELHLENVVLTNGADAWPGLAELSLYCHEDRVYFVASFLRPAGEWVNRGLYPIFRTLPVGVSCRWVTMDFGWRYVR